MAQIDMTAMPVQSQLCISGAGIAGMATALALAAKGIKVTLSEKNTHLNEVGTGLQLGPNATALLRQWGLLDAVCKHAVEPEALDLKDGKSGQTLVHMDLRRIAHKRWQAPYLVIHRADLQSALQTAVMQNPLIDFQLGHDIRSYSGSAVSGFSTEVFYGPDKKNITTPLLAACDGVWSQMRAKIEEQAIFSGYIAWRATLKDTALPPAFFATGNQQAVMAWMGPNGHFVSYPLRQGKIFNLVAITRGENPGKTWAKQGDKNRLLELFNSWHPVITATIEQAADWTYWPLFKMPFARFLGPNHEIFLGDASHAVTPFAAQGAAMAIEDAGALAATLACKDMPQIQALHLFDIERRKRLATVTKRGDFNRFVYHATGPLAFARNLVMKTRPAEKFLADLDWLYGYDCTAFLPKAA